VQRLRELGWIEGRTVAFEYRWAGARNEHYTDIAAELVKLKVDVIVSFRECIGSLAPEPAISAPTNLDAVGTALCKSAWAGPRLDPSVAPG
jgi:hypothetical protein